MPKGGEKRRGQRGYLTIRKHGLLLIGKGSTTAHVLLPTYPATANLSFSPVNYLLWYTLGVLDSLMALFYDY